jgi:hypothetical protein
MIQVESAVPVMIGSTTSKTTSLTIKTSTMQLASIRSDKKVKLHIDTTHTQPMIANQGDAVTIKTTNTQQGVTVATIAKDHVVVITNQGKLEEEINALSKKFLIGDQEIAFGEMFGETVSGDILTGAVVDTGTIPSIIADIQQENATSTVKIVKNTPIKAIKESLPTKQVEKPVINIIEPGLGTTNLLTEEKLRELKLQLYAPHLQSAIRTMMIAYAKADYQTFLIQKKQVSKAIINLYSLVGYEPHIRVIASDPQVAVRQYQTLIEQLILNINRSRGIPAQYINKLASTEVMFMIMRNVGYGKFVNQKMNDDEIWNRI